MKKESGSYISKSKKNWCQDLAGVVFGSVTAIRFLGRSKQGNVWECVCSCGKIVVSTTSKLNEGRVKSCGCDYVNPTKTHGMTNTRMYRIWQAMRSRCYNKNVPCYPDYGGRGITVCKRWKDSFVCFYNDMKEGYGETLRLDRIKNDGNYCKSNCKWATDYEQARNKRNNRWFEYDGKKMVLKDWADLLGVNYNSIFLGLKAGYTFSQLYDHYKNRKFFRIKDSINANIKN